MADDPRALLLGRTARELRGPHETARAELLAPDARPANVIGVGVGVKWTGGVPTGEPAVLTLVTHKVGIADLSERDRLPPHIDGVKTDVVAVGLPIAGAAPAGPVQQTLTARVRPVKGGYSIGHKDITAGTTATAVYDLLPGGTLSPPALGVGIPTAYYVLSNNHILANGNAAAIGDAILQPGPYDGGKDPQDRIASLSRFIPISFAPEVPLENHNNIVDCAIASATYADIDREIFWIGGARGWRRRSGVNVGSTVQKVGRSSCYTVGRIIAVNTTIDISYGKGKMARFHDQFLTTPMSTPGDSGSLILSMDGVAVGLLCAGSPASTVVNQIENVRSLLWVEVGGEAT
ncbi:MAG TPA: hypothetical protein VE596_09240 [Gaiellaceae bacterium]|nr:hypothetical protein [Gaiellaceae bacterium]